MKYHRQCVCLLLQVIFFVANCLAENLILNINFKKPIAITDHAFLSFTLDSTTLLHNNDFIKNIERSTNMARGLAPAYVRLGGPQSNFYNFERPYSLRREIDIDNDMHFGTQWTFIYQWAKNAGLDVIACISPHYIDNELKTHSTDPRNIADLLSYSNRMGYNISWQLGYECQTRCDISGEELGRYVVNLHEMLKSFPRYSNSLITGPDIVAYRTVQQQRYLQDYLHSADAALSAITWHPNLDSVSLNNDNISMHYDNMIVEKDEIYKIISRVAGKKPLWIAESKSDESKNQYLETLIWMRRLGNAAKLGIQVVMKQLSDLSRANPIYWMSLLYKTLVGREVLEIKFQSNNESQVHFYSQCTKPSALYGKGAITIFGINLTSRKVTASLKNLKIKILHKYILSPDFETGNKMFSEKVLLNNKPLNLINDNLPDINPEIIINPDGLELELSSGDIGFWIIPDAKVKACIWSEEETTENGIVKKLSKRHENYIQQDNQEEKEKDINQSNVIEEDVKKDTSQSNSKNRKIYTKQNRKNQKNVENTKNESQQKFWNSKLLARIKRILQKRLQKNGSSNLQRSFMIDLGEEQGNSSEEVEQQQNLDKKHFEKTEVDDKFESIRDTLKKYKCILLEKRSQIDTQDSQDLKLQIQNIDNAVALIAKIEDAFLLHKVTSNEPIMGEDKDKAKNKEESIIKMDKKLKEYLIELQNSAETKANIIKKIEKYFNKVYNLLEDNDSTKDDKNSQISIHENLMERKRFKRHLDRKPENSKNIRILKKRSGINNLKDYAIIQKIKQKNDDRKELISYYNSYDNSKKNFNYNKNKYNNLSERDPVKTFFKNNAFENAARDIDYNHLTQEHKKVKSDNIYRKYPKIGDMEKYRSLVQESERTKRDINKKLVEIGLRKDSAFRKRSRIDDLKNYVIERKIKQKDDIKREGLLVPFNPRTIDSDENNFYGFFRREPVKGFPEGDIFVSTGDSLEQNSKDYDYVEDDYDDNGSEKKNTQHSQKSMLDHTEDNTWVEEIEDDHCDNMPNEFFENIKFSNTKIKENSKNYEDLWEAEFPFEEHNNNKNNNNKFTVTEVIQEQPPNEEKEKRVRETSVQQLVNNYDDSEKQKYDQDAKYKALQSASRYSSTSFDRFPKTSTSNINYQASNVELKEAKLKMAPEQKISNSFYLLSQAPIARYNYSNYQTSNMNHDEDKLKTENGFVTNIDSRYDINAKTTQYSKPINADYPTHDKIFHNERKKRSNWKELQKVFAEEMIKEDEENTKDCHCRVIRASDSPKEFFYRRVKRNSSLLTPRSTDISSEDKSVNADDAQSEENVQHSMTGEEYEEILAGEILPSTSVIELDYDDNSTTTESAITELNTLDDKSIDITQKIDVTSISGVDNISGQYNEKKSTTNLLSLDSVPELSLNNNDSVNYVTKKTFFRAQPDIQSENKTKTYDSPQTISKILSQNKDNRKELTVFVTTNAQETTSEKIQDLIDKKEKADCSIYPTITENQENEEGHDNDYKTGLKLIDSLEEITEKIAEQVTTETILKRATSTEVDNSESNESERKSKLLQNVEDNQNSESRTQLGKDANAKKLKTMLQNLPRASVEKLTRYEGHLTRRTEHIDKRKEKLYSRREKLLYQYQNELTKIADEQKRNLKRREALERFRESDDFRRLIDQREFIEVLLDDDVTFEDDDESYLIPIEFIPKQHNNIIDQVYLLAKAKKVRYPEHNKYYQFLRNLIKDDEELAETSKSSEHNQYYEYIPKIIDDKQKAEGSKFLDREHNQDCQDSPKTVEDERESTETISKSFDHKVFIIDPSTYYGGEPILQLHENYLKLPKYHSNIKSQIQKPTSRWLLGNFHRILSRLKSSEDQHQASKLKEYIKKLPIKDYYDQENANIFYVLDTQRQYDPSKKLAALAQVWLTSLNRRDVNQPVSNEEADELNNMHKNLKADKNNLDSKLAINKKTGFIRDFLTERNIENKEFVSSNNKNKDTLNSETTEDAEIVKIKKSENDKLTKHEEVNKSYNSNNKAENNLNINNNKAIEHVKKIIDYPEAKELGKENIRTRRDVGKQTDECIERSPYFLLTRTNVKNGLNRDRSVHLEEDISEEIFNKQPIALLLLTKEDKLLSADLKSKNRLVSSRRDFKTNQEKGYKSNYITLLPIKVKNIYEMLEAKNNDDSLERFQIPARKNDQYILGKISDSMNKYLDDKTSEEFEYEDLSYLQSEDTENISDEESCSSENKQDVSIEDSEAESEKENEYRITNDEIDKYLGIKNQIRSNKRGKFLLLPWKNIKKRQRRQIKNEINEDIAQVKRKVTRQSQPNKSILAEDFKNKRTKRYYFNNDIDTEVEENIIEANDIRGNYLKSQTNRKNPDNLLEDFIKAHKKDNLYNKISFVKNKENNEIILLNNISKSDKKLQDVMSKLQDHTESVKEFINDSEENFNDTLASNEDNYYRISGTTNNAFYTAIMNFFALFSKISQIFMHKF